MRVKKIFICLMLMFAICAPVVEPGIINETTNVSYAKTYSIKTLRKRFKSLHKGVSQNWVKRSIKKKLGAPVYDTTIQGYRWRDYCVMFKTKNGKKVYMHFSFWAYALMKKTWEIV